MAAPSSSMAFRIHSWRSDDAAGRRSAAVHLVKMGLATDVSVRDGFALTPDELRNVHWSGSRPEVLPACLTTPARDRPGKQVRKIKASGPRETAKQLVQKFHPQFLSFADNGTDAFARYRVRVTPFCFVIGDDGLVRAKALCSDRLQLRDLLVAAGLKSTAQHLEVVSQFLSGGATTGTRGGGSPLSLGNSGESLSADAVSEREYRMGR